MPRYLVKWTPLLTFLEVTGRSLGFVLTSKIFFALGKLFGNRKDFFVVRLAILFVLERLIVLLLLLIQTRLGIFVFTIDCFIPFDRFTSGRVLVCHVKIFDSCS